MTEAPDVRYKTFIFDSARWDGFAFRPGDIVITTPPKCGTTWTQMLCALLIFQTPTFDRSLDQISPWLEMNTRTVSSVFGDLDAQTHRRFIKSHTPFDGIPMRDDVTYIAVGRDPRDVFRSWDNHMANMDLVAMFAAVERAVGAEAVAEQIADGPPVFAETEVERFWDWVDDEETVTSTLSLASTMRHLDLAWSMRAEPNVVLLHYADLQRDLEGQMRRVAGRLAIDVPEDRWPELVRAATFDEMKSRADRLAPDTSNAIWQSNSQFFNRGCNEQWRDLIGDDDLDRYFTRVNALAPPNVVRWAHEGGDQS